MIAVTLTAYNRPQYLRQTLDSLARCVGIDQCLFLPQVEPADDSVWEMVQTWAACPVEAQRNRKRLFLNRNTYTALDRAFHHPAQFTSFVHVEDDILLSRDALQYFVWAIEQLRKSDKYLIVSAYSRPRNTVAPDERHLAAFRHVFTPIAWGIDRERLKFMLDQWSFRCPTKFTQAFRYRYSRKLLEIYPLLSRSETIGYERASNPKSRRYYATHYDLRPDQLAQESDCGGSWKLDCDRPYCDLRTSIG